MSVGDMRGPASATRQLDRSGAPPAPDGRTDRRHVIAAAGVTALGGLLFGYATGVVSGALLFVRNEFGGLSSFQQELVTSLLLIGAMVGAFGAGRVADRIGRRPTILITAVVFVVGVLLAASSPTLWTLPVARVVIGLTLLHAITPRGVFFLFAFLCLVSLAYFAKRVPETKQRSLQEIEQDLGAQMSAEGALSPTTGPGRAGAGTQRSDQ
jgi:MFS family permease